MQRDKRGRFVKKAYTGTTLGVPSLNTTVNFNGTTGLNTGFVGTGGMNGATVGTSMIGDTVYNLDFAEYLEAKKLNPTLQYNQWLLTKNKLKTPAVTNGASVETDAGASEVTTSLDTDQDSTTTNTTTGRIPTKSDIANMHSELEALFGKKIFNPAAIKPIEYKTPFELEAERKQAYTNARQYSMLYGNKADWNNIWAPNQILYTEKPDGTKIDQYGREISTQEFFSNPGIYKKDIKPMTFPEVKPEDGGGDDESDGMTFFNEKEGFGSKLVGALGNFNGENMADLMSLVRAGIGASVNNKIAERALEAEKPFLQDVTESHRSVYGDYRSKIQGEKAAAQLRSLASKPLTSDGAIQQKMMMDAQIKGQEYIDAGNAKDDAMVRQTGEVAWQQNKENQQQRQAAAMQNRQAMLMTSKNKAQIENARDSANYSQIVNPLLTASEQRLRNKAQEQSAYKEYFDDARIQADVYKNFREGVSDSQAAMLTEYLNGGLEGLNKFIGEDETKKKDWLAVQQLMSDEIIRRKAELHGVTLNNSYYGVPKTTSPWSGSTMDWLKSGGTIYKAKLIKRAKDNDRAARSIESSKKIAARFLEKAMDSLYTYDQIELIAKPKKSKRKYQAGGGLPFVSFTPVFATSERGANTVTPETKKDKDSKGDLTSKDVLELLKDMDGLPSDMQLIMSSLQNFSMIDKMDPLGLSTSSDIASRYISLINKIKVAKFNREEYNQAFNQLKGNGGLNELAITSEGMLIGTNKAGDFAYFTPEQVNSGEPKNKGYSLLTNSNLLYLRANSLDAAFNHQLTTVAQNGIGMEVITKQISDIISGLGKSKESEEGFVQMGSNGQVKQGLKYLQKVASEVGDKSIFDDMSVADYYQAGYLTEDQANQAELALNYIWSALPSNAKSMLMVKGGGAKGAMTLVKSLVYSKTSSEVQFKATPKKMAGTSSGSGSGTADGVDELKLSPVQMMQVGYTDHMQVTLQKGTKYATRVNAQVLPITDVNKKLLGVTTLDKVAESTFGGALDMNNVTMGSQLIDPHALQNVQIDSTNLYVMNLPIDRSSPDGTIKPDLAWMTKIEEIDQTIRDQGITDVATINKLYTDAGLPVLMDDNGNLNLRDYCKFGVLNGHALNSAFKDLDLLDNTVVEIDDEDQISNVMSILNKGRGEKDRLDFDSKSWADSIFGTDHDSIYEGTIYIPIRTNAFTGMIGGGNYPDTQTAAEVEALIQQKERTRGYVDPGLLN